MAGELKLLVPSSVINTAVPMPQWVDGLALGAGAAESYTVPSDAGALLLSGDGGFYVNATTTAAAVTDKTDGSASLYLGGTVPVLLQVNSGDTLSFIATATRLVSIGVYKR